MCQKILTPMDFHLLNTYACLKNMVFNVVNWNTQFHLKIVYWIQRITKKKFDRGEQIRPPNK